MQIGSGEHDEMILSFDKYMKRSPIPCRLDKEPKSEWVKRHIYQDGHTNDLFNLYAAGYALARCVYLQ